jgi:hypothetical protein
VSAVTRSPGIPITAKLAALGMLYVEFQTEDHGRVIVAYTYAELGLSVLTGVVR